MTLKGREASEARDLIRRARLCAQSPRDYASHFENFKYDMLRSDVYRHILKTDKRTRGFVANYIERGENSWKAQRDALIAIERTLEDVLNN